MEYELLDTGIFKRDRYFDVFVEYAKAGPEDILVQITAANRDRTRRICISCRRCGSATTGRVDCRGQQGRQETGPAADRGGGRHKRGRRNAPDAGEYTLFCEGDVPLLFTENETNHERLFPGQKNDTPYVKDGINDCVVQGKPGAVNPGKQGTKVAAHYRLKVGPGQSAAVRLRLTGQAAAGKSGKTKTTPSYFGTEFEKTMAARLQEADEFYRSVTPPSVSPDAANVMRQAIAGMLWSKQFYFFDGDNWLDEHNSNPLHTGYRASRNSEWFHMVNEDIISMPDKWEYPWYAAWDLAFHTLPLAIVDPDFPRNRWP